MRVSDVSRAHYNTDAEREFFVNMPEELHEPGYAANFMKAYPDTQDAARMWSGYWTSHLEKHGLKNGKSNRSSFASNFLRGCSFGKMMSERLNAD